MAPSNSSGGREAQCACGALKVATAGEPLQTYACSCRNCQRESGSVFTYSAVFPEAAVSVTGARTTWRRQGDSGRWIDIDFCPTCGTTVLARMEAWPEVVTVSVGCFADPNFAGPEILYWPTRRHHWLELPAGIELDRSPPEETADQ